MILEKRGIHRILCTDDDCTNAIFVLDDILRLGAIENENYNEDKIEYKDMFYEYKNYTLDEIIKEVLIYDGYMSDSTREKLLNKVKLQEYLCLLLMMGRIVMNDVVGGDSTYRLVPRCYMNSGHTRGYAKIDLGNIDRVLLTSDTHIGDEEHEDFDMMHYVFNYARDRFGISTVLHLGDVFHGIRLDKGKYAGLSYYSAQVQEILDKQLEKFEKYFPDFMNVIAIEGNHDTSIIEYLNHANYLGYGLNQLYLSILKPNFHMLRQREFGNFVYGPNIKIGLSHPLRFNIFFPYVKTNVVDVEDEFISGFKEINTDDVDLLLSGHFHFNRNFSLNDDNGVTRRIFEVVPSLSKLCLDTKDKCVSKILRFVRDINGNVTHFGITPLYYINKEIVEGEEIVYPTNNMLIEENESSKNMLHH
jgi:predicted phosphodiesterase